jgi:hypothetical protein
LSNWLTGILPHNAVRRQIQRRIEGKLLNRRGFLSDSLSVISVRLLTQVSALPDAPKKDPRIAAGIFWKLSLPTHLNSTNQTLARRLRIMHSSASMFLSAIIMPMKGAKIRH